MTTAGDIRWGTYTKYEGPYFPGKLRYTIPSAPDFWDKTLAVLTATEGGCYDAINMYDRCILSVGLIQWCEAAPQCSVSTMLERCYELDSFLLTTLIKKYPQACKVEFLKNKQGKYRFYLNGKEVVTQDDQRSLFLGGPQVGEKGTWREGQKNYAKAVAAWFANIWDVPLFRTVQATFTKAKIPAFALPEAQKILQQFSSNEGWEGALKAAFYSFAGNLPAVANKTLKAAAASPEWASADSADKARLALQSMTFGAGVAIYPGRYDKIAPVLNKHFQVQLPVTSGELKNWKDAPSMAVALSEEESAHIARMNKLHDDIQNGISGATALDLLMKSHIDE